MPSYQPDEVRIIVSDIKKHATKAMNLLFEKSKFYDDNSDNHMFLHYIIGEYGRIANNSYWDDFKDIFSIYNYRILKILDDKSLFDHSTSTTLTYSGNKDNDINSTDFLLINQKLSLLINKMDFTYCHDMKRPALSKASWIEWVAPTNSE